MKTMKNKLNGARLRLGTFLIGMMILGISCQKQMDVNAETTSRQVEVLSNKPGDLPIAQIAMDKGFNELVAALKYVDMNLGTGLVDMFLNGKDQYTVFAPTDDAFQELYGVLSTPNAVVDEISDLPAELVLAVLQYHVTGGRRASNSVLPKNGMREISTLLPDASFSVDKTGMITAIGSTAMITAANINASNGIIHVVNHVLLPIVP